MLASAPNRISQIEIKKIVVRKAPNFVQIKCLL